MHSILGHHLHSMSHPISNIQFNLFLAIFLVAIEMCGVHILAANLCWWNVEIWRKKLKQKKTKIMMMMLFRVACKSEAKLNCWTRPSLWMYYLIPFKWTLVYGLYAVNSETFIWFSTCLFCMAFTQRSLFAIYPSHFTSSHVWLGKALNLGQ